MSLLTDLLDGGKKSPSSQIKKTAVPVLPGEIYKTAKLQLQDILAPAALEISTKSIKIAGKTSRTFFVMSYPRFLTDGWLSPIIKRVTNELNH